MPTIVETHIWAARIAAARALGEARAGLAEAKRHINDYGTAELRERISTTLTAADDTIEQLQAEADAAPIDPPSPIPEPEWKTVAYCGTEFEAQARTESISDAYTEARYVLSGDDHPKFQFAIEERKRVSA